MDLLRQLNRAVAQIEANLGEEIDLSAVAQTACASKDGFMRLFRYLTGMTVSEYIRRRRLSLAGCELRNAGTRVIDVAVQYGWNSADAFAKAFVRQHGVTPSRARNPETSLKLYPPVSFHMQVKGAKEMDYRMVTLGETEVWGVARQFDGVGYRSREELRYLMWAEDGDDVPGTLCAGRWNQAGNHAYDGVWYGIWHDGKYMIARETADARQGRLERFAIPSGRYAAFRTGRGGLAWEELPELRTQILDSWLPNSPYARRGDLLIEVLHLWTDQAERRANRFYEIWLPVAEK